MADRFTRLVGCRLPLQQAGMGGVTTPALAAAVARAGGLGMLAGAGLGPEAMVEAIETTAGLAGAQGRFGVNFLVPFLDRHVFETAATAAAVVEGFYGDPDASLVEVAHDGGALVGWQTGSVRESEAAAGAGCDFVVVQGVEAGGHVRGTVPLRDLLPAVRAAVDVPLVAAGGLGSRADVRRALDAGADAVRIGTRFVATAESTAHDAYVDALVASAAGDTVLTEAFSMAWPDAPHRVLRRCVDASDAAPALRSPLPPTVDTLGPVDAAAMYAGTSVGAVRRRATVAEVVAELFPDPPS